MPSTGWLAVAGLVLGCSHERLAAAPSPPADPPAALPARGGSTEYVVADPVHASAPTLLPLSADARGVVVDGARIVLGPAGASVARDVADSPIQAAWPLPRRLGGGFLFRAKAELLASNTFDGPLRPVVTLPSDVVSLSFGTDGVLVRSEAGERWMVDPRTGGRGPISPPGLLDVAALDDGRGAALIEGGGVLVTADAGAHWTDATAQLHSPAHRVLVLTTDEGEPGVWIETEGGAARVTVGGRIAEYDALPAAAPAPLLRAKVPAWREDDAPLRHAMRLGAPLEDGSALVIASGDLVKVDLVSGAVDVVVAGRLPPDAVCAGTRTTDDVVFTCGRPTGTAFFVAHALAGAPVIEQTFQEAAHFVVSDDGGVAFVGACDRPGAQHTACVRGPGGVWAEVTADAAVEDAGTASLDVVRWIARADGDAMAVVSGLGGSSEGWGIADARTGEIHPWSSGSATAFVRAALTPGNDGGTRGGVNLAGLADRGWTTTTRGTLLGWAALPGGTGGIEVGPDGSVQASAFAFEKIAPAGPFALARLRDGRVWQTVDRGGSWIEVAAPPVAQAGGALDGHACSVVGCDLGPWYRVGWDATQPVSVPPAVTAPPAPRMARVAAPVLTCRTTGDVVRTAVSRTARSPDDLGLGATRVAVGDGVRPVDFLRIALGRRVLGPSRDPDSVDDGAPRALLHGPATEPGDDGLVVLAPDRDVLGLVRQLAYVQPFDARGAIRSAPLAVRDLVAAARAAGESVADAVRDDPTPTAAIPVTPRDPNEPDGILVQLSDGALAFTRPAGDRANGLRFVVEPTRGDEWRVVGAQTVDSDALWLEEDASGHARVKRVGPSGSATTVFEFDAPSTGDFYPPNVDTLAIGPHGDVGILRTPSGSEPASELDPAVVVLPNGSPLPLAPWSTLRPAGDPACQSDPSGWRATLQTTGPWLRLTGPGALHGQDDATLLARVRWGAARVCLEAVEARAVDVTMPGAGNASDFGSAWDQPVESWVVARFAGGSAAGRVGVLQGAELRQPLACTLGPP